MLGGPAAGGKGLEGELTFSDISIPVSQTWNVAIDQSNINNRLKGQTSIEKVEGCDSFGISNSSAFSHDLNALLSRRG